MQVEIKSVEVIVNPEFNAAEIIITPIFSSGEGSTGIQSVSKNGTPIIPIGGNVNITVPTKTSDLTNDSDFVADANYVHTDNNYTDEAALEVAKIVEKANSSDVYTKSETFSQTEINNKLSAVYEFKGSVLTYAALPTDAENADVWNVEENGVNYAWVQATSSWDSLGGLIGLATLTENGLLSKEDFALLRNLYTADEIDQLLLGFAKLSGGNTFAGNQTFDTDSLFIDSVNHKVAVGYIASLFHKFQVNGNIAAKKFYGSITNLAHMCLDLATDVTEARFNYNGADVFKVNSSGVANVLLRLGIGKSAEIPLDVKGSASISDYIYQPISTVHTGDAINDTRTSNQSGVKIEEICTAVLAGVANVKGSGTWKGTNAVSPIGGNMIKLTNKTGAASVKGTVIYASPTTDLAFTTNPIDGDMPFGIVYDNGIADGAECWVVVSGVAEVLLVNSVASTRSYIAYSSASVAGRIDTAATAPASMLHFREIGHTLESKTAGTNVLCKCVLHFN